MKLLIPFLLICVTVTAFAQAPREVELFGTIGVMRGGGDEGSSGSGAAFGGAATIPIVDRWAIDLQVLTARFGDGPDLRTRRLLFSPGLQYRRGNDRALWFIAFGPGLQQDRTKGSVQVFEGNGTSRLASTDVTQSGLTLHWRTGAVFQPSRRVLVRSELFWVNRYVLPDVGVAVSLGVRLGR